MESRFKAKLAFPSIMLTAVVSLFIVFISFKTFFGSEKNLIQCIIISFVLIVLLLAYLLHPVEYIINDDGIKIRRYLKPILIRKDFIINIESVSYERLRPRFRMFGSGGFCGFFGLFISSGGMVNMQASNLSNLVLIRVKKGFNIVISPENRDEFIEKFKNI